MARQVLGALTTLNLSTNLDPMFLELYNAAGGDYTTTTTFTIGNGTAARLLVINGGTGGTDGGAIRFQRGGVNGFIVGDAGGVLGTGGADGVLMANGATNIRFWTNGLERMRVDSAGNLIVGGTSNPLSAASRGSVVMNGTAEGAAIFTVAGALAGYITGAATAVEVGSTTLTRFVTGGALRFTISSTGVVTPGADNAQTLGSASLRWSTVYAATGTINTSDAREKTAVHDLDTAELDCAMALSKEIGSFKFLSAVAQKNAGARLHIGMTVQRAMEVMESFGLDPLRYAFICHDEWPAEHDEDGKETKPAGDRYGFRADELGLFIMRGLAARLDALEG